MRWLEIIRLRTAKNYEGVLEDFLRSVPRVDGDRGLMDVKAYHLATVATDLSVQLHWKSDRPEQDGTVLGLRLAEALKEFGLVDHTVWIEDER